MSPDLPPDPPKGPKPQDLPPRGERRIPFETRLVFDAEKGSVHTGLTKDVSLSGAFLITDHRPEGVLVGDVGVATLTRHRGGREFSMSFPCVVARVTATGLGLDFESPEEAEADPEEDDDREGLCPI
ncbi:MAG: PilZ domain-containing protein [Magnetococcales bacterium]|nr:PilZ domain-containing protein [Magnetococcales bacterium]MBF0156863.1 PilZ domain-containing protein [Magnetococcales bacterium]